MATHPSVLAWKVPWTEEPARLHAPWGHKESNVTVHIHTHTQTDQRQHTRFHTNVHMALQGDFKALSQSLLTYQEAVLGSNSVFTLYVLGCTQSCPTLCDPMACSLPGSSVHGDSPGKNTEMGCHALLQGNPPNPGIEPRSPTLRVLYHLSHQGSPLQLSPVPQRVECSPCLSGYWLALTSTFQPRKLL